MGAMATMGADPAAGKPYIFVLTTVTSPCLSPPSLTSVLTQPLSPSPSPFTGAAANPMLKMGGPFQQARNFAVMTGVNAGLTSLMKRTRGIDDIQNA